MSREAVVEKDVIIAGGGMAGVSAALSAARTGARVLVIEQNSCLGGLATGGLVTPLMLRGIYTVSGTKVVAGNLDSIFPDISKHSDHSFNQELLKCTLDRLLGERHVEILFNTFIYEVERDNGNINRVVAVHKSGITKFSARMFIDTTGDADIAHKAGIPCKSGRETDNKTQAVSLRFNLGNVDIQKARNFMVSSKGKREFKAVIENYNRNSDVKILDTEEFQNFTIADRPNELAFNCPRIIGVQATDAEALSKAYITGRQKIVIYYKLLKEHVPGCENAYISNIADLLGVRESRRIQGAYILTDDDVISGRKFPDGVACNAWFIDIHNPSGRGVLGHTGKQQLTFRYPESGWNDIPYRCLYSREIKNLLVAGRCISATHEALAAVRIMASCIAMGQAAGIAARLLLESGSRDAAGVDVSLLRKELTEEGALITGCSLLYPDKQ